MTTFRVSMKVRQKGAIGLFCDGYSHAVEAPAYDEAVWAAIKAASAAGFEVGHVSYVEEVEQ